MSALLWLVENRHHRNYFSLLSKSGGCHRVVCGTYTCAVLGPAVALVRVWSSKVLAESFFLPPTGLLLLWLRWHDSLSGCNRNQIPDTMSFC